MWWGIAFSVYCFASQKPKETLKNATPCAKCEKLKKDKKKLQRKLKTMESKVEELSQKIIANQSEWAKTFLELNQSPDKLKSSTGTGEMD